MRHIPALPKPRHFGARIAGAAATGILCLGLATGPAHAYPPAPSSCAQAVQAQFTAPLSAAKQNVAAAKRAVQQAKAAVQQAKQVPAGTQPANDEHARQVAELTAELNSLRAQAAAADNVGIRTILLAKASQLAEQLRMLTLTDSLKTPAPPKTPNAAAAKAQLAQAKLALASATKRLNQVTAIRANALRGCAKPGTKLPANKH